MPTRRDSETFLSIRPLASALLFLVAVASCWPGPFTWGVALLPCFPGLPTWLAVAWPLLFLGLLWTPLVPRIGAGLVAAVDPYLQKRLVAMVLLPLLGTALAWAVRARTPLLGDGVLISGLLGDGTLHHGFDFMAYHLHVRLAGALGVDDLLSGWQLLTYTSLATGLAYLVTVGWSARALAHRPGEALLLWVLLVVAASWQLFLGYAECYAQLTVCLLLTVVALVREREGRGRLRTVGLWFGAALFWHLNAVFLAPLLVTVALAGGPEGQPRWHRTWLVAWPAMVALGLGAGLLLTTGAPMREVLIDDFTAPQQGRRLFNALTGSRGLADWRLWKDVMNLMLLLVPVPLVLLVAAGRRTGSAATRWLIGGAAGLLAVALLLHLKLGLVRDWDLLAGHAVLVTLAAFTAVRRVVDVTRLVGCVVMLSLALAAPWFAVNANAEVAVARQLVATADLPPYPRGLAMEDLGRWSRERGDVDLAARAYRLAAVAAPGHGRFGILHGQALYEKGDLNAAVGALRRAVAGDPDNLLAHRMLLMCLTDLKRPEAALPHARALAEGGDGDWQVARAHGVIAEQLGLNAEAQAAYTRAWRLAPARVELAVRAGELALAAGRPAEGEELLRAVLAREPRDPAARMNLARLLWVRETEATRPDQPRIQEVLNLLDNVDHASVTREMLDGWRQAVRDRLGAVGQTGPAGD